GNTDSCNNKILQDPPAALRQKDLEIQAKSSTLRRIAMKRTPILEPRVRPYTSSEVIARPIGHPATVINSGDGQEGGFVLAPWERAAVHRLSTLLPHQILEGLLGPLTYTVRKLREM